MNISKLVSMRMPVILGIVFGALGATATDYYFMYNANGFKHNNTTSDNQAQYVADQTTGPYDLADVNNWRQIGQLPGTGVVPKIDGNHHWKINANNTMPTILSLTTSADIDISRLMFDGSAELNLGSHILRYQNSFGVGPSVILTSGTITTNGLNATPSTTIGKLTVDGATSRFIANELTINNDSLLCVTNGGYAEGYFKTGISQLKSAFRNAIVVSGEGSVFNGLNQRFIICDQSSNGYDHDFTMTATDGGLIRNFKGEVSNRGPNSEVIIDGGQYLSANYLTVGGSGQYATNNGVRVCNGGVMKLHKSGDENVKDNTLTIGGGGSENWCEVASEGILSVGTFNLGTGGSNQRCDVKSGGKLNANNFYLGNGGGGHTCTVSDGGEIYVWNDLKSPNPGWGQFGFAYNNSSLAKNCSLIISGEGSKVTAGDFLIGNSSQSETDGEGNRVNFGNKLIVKDGGLLDEKQSFKVYGPGTEIVVSNGTIAIGNSFLLEGKVYNTTLTIAGTNSTITANSSNYSAFVFANKFNLNFIIGEGGYSQIPIYTKFGDIVFNDDATVATYDIEGYRKAGGGTVTLMKTEGSGKKIQISETQLAKLRETLPEACKLILSEDEKELSLKVSRQGLIVIIK